MAADLVTIDVDLPDVYDYPDESSVGRLYQVGINGYGYMLADTPDRPGYRRSTAPLDPQRLATGATPFSEAIERYSFASSADFSGGAGQRYMHRPQSLETAFYSSHGVDPFSTPGEVTLLNATTQEVANTYANLRLVVVGDRLFALTSADTLTYSSTPGGSTSTVQVQSGVTVKDLTSDGQYWYACDGNDVYRSTTTTPSGAWSTQNAYEVQWAAGRICAAVATTGTTPNRFTTLNDSGAEERTNGHLTLPAGTTITLGGETAGHVYFGASSGNTGSVYAWPLGLDSSSNFHTPFEALELPAGLAPTAVAVGGGMVWVRAYRTEGTNQGQAVILRCVPDQSGALVATTLVEIAPTGTTADHSVGGFSTHGDLVFFGWKTMSNSNAGVGAVDLVSGGWAKWLEAGADGDVTTIDVWQGHPVFAVVGQGVYRENPSAYVSSGELVTSIADGGSVLDKLWDDVVMVCSPLPSGSSITVSHSLDNYASWTSIGAIDTAGTTTRTLPLNKEAKTSALKLVLARTGSSAPTLSLAQTRYHPLGLADTIVQFVVDCGDQLAGLNGAPLPENGVGSGARRARTLEALVQKRIKYQDIDWHIVGGSEVFEVESCDVGATLMYDASGSGQALRLLATLTIRKAG